MYYTHTHTHENLNFCDKIRVFILVVIVTIQLLYYSVYWISLVRNFQKVTDYSHMRKAIVKQLKCNYNDQDGNTEYISS